MPAVNHELLRSKRDELDLSNGDLAKLVDTTANYVSNVLRGADEPSMRLVHRFARALKLDADEIVATDARPTGDPSDPPKQPTRPAGPARRQDTETTKKAPKRPGGVLPVAS